MLGEPVFGGPLKVEDAGMQRIRAEQGLEVVRPKLGTTPRVQ